MPKVEPPKFRHPSAWILDVPPSASAEEKLEARRRQGVEDAENLCQLARFFGVDPTGVSAGWLLALKLAQQHYREPERPGRSTNWNEFNRCALAVDIEIAMRQSTYPLTKADAARTVLRKPRWKWVRRHSDIEKATQAVLRQQSQARGVWLETIRDAANLYLERPELGHRLDAMLDHFAKPVKKLTVAQKIEHHRLAGALWDNQESNGKK